MNYRQAIAYAAECAGYGCVPGLENMQDLLGRLGNPQNELVFVHIAGTNGKGSVMNFISTVLTEEGYKPFLNTGNVFRSMENISAKQNWEGLWSL